MPKKRGPLTGEKKFVEEKTSPGKTGKRSCGKLVFSTKKKTVVYINRQRDLFPLNAPLRPYKCDKCPGWHTTSQLVHGVEPKEGL